MAQFDYQVGMPSASDSLTSEHHKREKRIENEVRKAAHFVEELREKFEGWGFSPTLDLYVQDLIDESGYSVGHIRNKDGTWTDLTSRKSDGKFDPAHAQSALNDLKTVLWGWDLGLVHGQLREEDRKVLGTLAAGLYSAAKTSLEKHGDLRDAVKEMSDYRLRERSHPNVGKRDLLHYVLHLYVSAREQYEADEGLYLAGEDPYGGVVGWQNWEWGRRFDHNQAELQNVAAAYVRLPDVQTRWLTNEISASLLKPYMFGLGLLAKQRFPPNRIGAGWKKPWCIVVPLCVSALLFLLSLSLVIGCYLLLAPMAAYGAAGICGLLYARRYVQAREFGKERARYARLWGEVSDLHKEVKSGIYNAGEAVRRFREIEADDVRLPSIFVSVIALPEVQLPEQLKTLTQAAGAEPHEVQLLEQITGQLKKLSEMAEFVGEQSFPSFANKVKSFKDVQEDLAAAARFASRLSQAAAMRQPDKRQSESQEKAEPTKIDTRAESA
jgi:hypothetical protein